MITVNSWICLEKPLGEIEARFYILKSYKSAIEAHIYAILGFRQDICYIISQMSQYRITPDCSDWTAVNRIFPYLTCTPNHSLWLRMVEIRCVFIYNYWVSDDNQSNMSSYTFLLNRSAISLKRKKQSMVTLSTEVEYYYMAITQAVKTSITTSYITRSHSLALHK